MKHLIFALLLFIFISCKEKRDKTSVSDGFTTDTNQVLTPQKPTGRGAGTAFGYDDSLFIKDPALSEAERKRTLLYMAIDSTYAAMKDIEEIKNELSVSAVGLSLPERNVKAKALMQLNKIGNALTRNIDSALLINLKQQTEQLKLINTKLDNKVEHLQELSEKLARAGKVMERLTDLLTLCVAKGIIKPATPANKLPVQVKTNVN